MYKKFLRSESLLSLRNNLKAYKQFHSREYLLSVIESQSVQGAFLT